MYTFTYDLDRYNEKGIEKEKIRELINVHRSTELPRLQRNLDYYLGKHDILKRQRIKDNAPNEKPVCNHAKDIADTATGFFMGTPISYTLNDAEKELDVLTDALDIAEADDVDSDNALDMSRCGVAYEYMYIAQGTNDIKLKNLEATNTFLVCDDTIEQNPLFAVYYYARKDSTENTITFKATVVTDALVYNLTILDTKGEQHLIEEPQEHFFGAIPIIEYRNGKEGISDYEQQIGLIDAYNTLMADRVNDKQQFIDAILVIYGSLLADDEEETSEAMKVLKEDKLLELPAEAKAEYLTRTFDETSVEVLRKAIKEDIYTFSHVPNLTDVNFAGNASGVAMEYKLIGLLKLIATKQKYYRKGLKKRFELMANYLKLREIAINPGAIIPKFSVDLPKDKMQTAQMISYLKGMISQKTLVSQLDFVEDPDGEIEAVKKENEEAIKQQQELFGNSKPNDEQVEDEE